MEQELKYKALLKAVESFIENAFIAQVTDESDSDYGGFKCPDYLICEPLSTVNAFTTMIIIFINPDSQYYHTPKLLQRINIALQFIIKSRNEDGTLKTYFLGKSHPLLMLVYVLNSLLKSYRVLSKDNSIKETLVLLEALIRKCAKTLKNYDSDHSIQRLAIASVLTDYDNLFLDHFASSKTETYITDGIDINHEGKYGDKVNEYNMLSNAMLLNIAKKMNKAYMIEYVRRNLNFNLYNLSINSEYRMDYPQDNLYGNASPFSYAVWKEMSIIDHNGYYATVGDMIIERAIRYINNGYINCHLFSYADYYEHAMLPLCRDYSGLLLTSNIGDFLLVEEEIKNDGIHRLPLPANYEKIFPESNIVSIKKGKLNIKITGNSKSIFSIENGLVVIQDFRISYNYFGVHHFEPKKLEINADSYVLRDWFRHSPPNSVQNIEPSQAELSIIVKLINKPNDFEINISAEGKEDIPFFFEFGIKRNGQLFINGDKYKMKDINMISMESGEALIQSGRDFIMIRGGKIQHRMYGYDDVWTANMKALRIMVTPITPFSNTIHVFWG